MNTPEENTENTNGPDDMGAENINGARRRRQRRRHRCRPAGDGADRRPLGFWLRVVDARLTREFHVLLEADGLDRRDWMILNAIAGTVDRGPLAARLERGGRRLRALVDRGWVTGTPGAWALTDEGRAAFERIGAKVADFRARVAGAVSPEDFATTLATLEAIAAELGEGDEEFGGFGRGRRGTAADAVAASAGGLGPRGFGRGYGPRLRSAASTAESTAKVTASAATGTTRATGTTPTTATRATAATTADPSSPTTDGARSPPTAKATATGTAAVTTAAGRGREPRDPDHRGLSPTRRPGRPDPATRAHGFPPNARVAGVGRPCARRHPVRSASGAASDGDVSA